MNGVEDYDDGYVPDEREFEPLATWSRLQSYLVLDTTVEENEESPDLARIIIRVSNQAPKGQNMPEVYFRNVRVNVFPETRYSIRNIQGN